jgi:hypothetical protein
VDIELDILQRGARFAPNQCHPNAAFAVSGANGSKCEENFDRGPSHDPNPSGPLHVIKVRVPLKQTPSKVPPRAGPPPDVDNSGAQLLAVVTSSSDRYKSDSELLYQILQTIRPY